VVFHRVYPDKGPLEGGTEITFNASIAAETRPTRVQFYKNTELKLDLPLSDFDRHEHDRFHLIIVERNE